MVEIDRTNLAQLPELLAQAKVLAMPLEPLVPVIGLKDHGKKVLVTITVEDMDTLVIPVTLRRHLTTLLVILLTMHTIHTPTTVILLIRAQVIHTGMVTHTQMHQSTALVATVEVVVLQPPLHHHRLQVLHHQVHFLLTTLDIHLTMQALVGHTICHHHLISLAPLALILHLVDLQAHRLLVK